MENPNSHLVLEHINNITIPANQSGIAGVINDIADYLMTSDREHLFVIALDDSNKPLNVNLAHVGTVNRSIASIRDIVKPALLSHAKKIVVLHNHPSGDILPSNEDKIMTQKLSQACERIGLSLVEHYIVGLEKGKYGRLIQTEATDILLTGGNQQPHVSEVPVVNLKLNNAVNSTYSKTYSSQEELEPAIRQFIDQQTENKHYAFCFGNKNQLVSIVGASDKVFNSQKGMELIRQRLILSNANKVVFAHTKPLKNQSEFLGHYTWIENEKKHFGLFDMKVLDAFVFFKDKSLSVLYPNYDNQKEFFNYSQEHSVSESNHLLESSKKLTKAELKQLPILEVAQSLGMKMIRSGREYYWDEHDSLKINPSKNRFSWYSRDIHGDTINLVQTIKEIPYIQAVQFLQTGTYTENYVPKVEPKKPFVYQLKQYETAFEHAKRYLVNTRGLSPGTVDFFISKGAVISAEYKTKDNPAEEVIVFQYKNYQDKIVGGSMQGITPNKDLHPGKGYLKKILFNSEGSAGFKVDVGTPERLIFFEAPIDLMSYYELNQDKLQNVRLIAMDGLKEVVISRALMEFMAFQYHTPAEKLNASLSRVNEYLDFVVENTTFFEEPGNDQMIMLAVDNDEAGLKFINKLRDKGCVFQVDLPENPEKLSKMDWNGLLYSIKEKQREFVQEKKMDLSMDNQLTKEQDGVDNNRLAQSKRKLERLQDELNQDIKNVFNHQKQTNGQPMNDKRSGAMFFKRQNALENRVSDKIKEIENQKERVERLERQEEYRERGLNRQGSGLEMSVSNIPNIKAEIEKYYKGESFYTRDTIKRYEKRLVELETMAEKTNNVTISPGAQHLIDEGLVKQWDKQPIIYFVTGMRKVAFVLNDDGTFGLSARYRPQRPEDHEKAVALLQKSREFNLVQEQTIEKRDFEKKETIKQSNLVHIEGTKKALENHQEQINDRTSGGTDFLQSSTEGSVIPVSQNDTFERTVTSRPTSSYPLLNFSTTFEKVQNKIGNYHPATSNDIKRLNQYAASIQSTAKWYLDELADTKINYVYSDNEKESILQVEFKKENFIHLLGIRPFEVGKQAGDFLVDLVQGNGNFNQLLISNAIKDKLQVIPMLSDILDSQSFVLNDLSSVEKLHKLNFSEAIKSKDEDFLLLFKDNGLENVPASLMKLKGNMAIAINNVNEKIVLGVYRERNGVLEQLSINEEYIKDGGKEMMSILENREEILEPIFQNIDSSVSDIEKIDRTKDSDGDGISDYDEIQQGTDPNNSRSNSKEKQQDNNDVPISELIANNDRLGLMTHLKEGMKQFAHSEQYKTYLTAMSKFYHYSPRNLQLLLAQNPHIQQVASYQSWQKDFERQVVKGEKALKVFVPLLVKQKDDNGNFIVDDNGEIQTRTIYKLGNVFDVSQTEGKALPQPVYRLESSVEGYKELYQAIKYINSQNDVSIHFDTLPGGVNGLYQPLENRIVISNRGMSEAQIIKTLIHETAHAQLHQKGNVNQLSDEYAIQELRAESIAYVVANHYGIDTSEYSFGYLHVWSGDKVDYSDLEKSLTTIQQTSKQFIEKIDTTLEKIKSNTLQKNQFNVNLEKAKQAEAQTILNKSVGGDVSKKTIVPTVEKY